ncbi:tRNA 2-selenouridine(34) synthase MnmH [Thiosulfativibrio zosterae]|uniref:tRNA 2-selenouridine synthase n=1 Tax=Thiosulfativibrio zosterae TaxID=2675053 RepID=A0A6F8PKF7_9GAMM|nr:tRNA 2-selenouridine(34) synthase MnmH [Thiosulfativibrio zosterae]BBP42544.1 tRNA 2-selenouridine synthase [Thiosulfativibrio zosterae]
MTKLTEFTHELPQTDDFRRIVFEQTPLIDVRAPIEFKQGAFPSAINLPLMTDDERQKIGLCYKQQGNAAAVKLGHQLVNEATRAPRVQSWLDFKQHHPDALLYCFRGGMRSKISQQWMADAGQDIIRLKGGYKAFRRFLIDFLDQAPELLSQQNIQPWVLAGRTGSGKTLVIQKLHNALDLEGLANHRGSAFGRHASPQPTQINFENQLSMALMRLIDNPEKPIQNIVVEDEGRNIGSVDIPKPLFEKLKSHARVILDTPLSERLAITFDEYVIQAQQEYPTLTRWENFMRDALLRIQKRLGGERYHRVLHQFNEAQYLQHQTGNIEFHQKWIKILLVEYYDPMYDYQLQKNQLPIAFKGNAEEVLAFFASQAE